MQQIKVTKIETKPMTRGGKMVAIFDEKGTRFSGFDASLQEISEGDIINADIKVSGIYNDIHSFEFIEKAPRSGAAPTGQQAAVNEDRVDARAAFSGAIGLVGASYPYRRDATPGDKVYQLFQAALDWGLAALKPARQALAGGPHVIPSPDTIGAKQSAPTAAAPGKDQKAAEPAPVVDLASLEFANPGEFYTACLKKLGLAKSKVDVEIAGLDIKDATQCKRAWSQLIAAYGKKNS